MIAVVPRDGMTVDPAALLAHCVEVIPRFAVPRYVRIVDALPKTPSQRIQKYKLRSEGITPGHRRSRGARHRRAEVVSVTR